MVILKTELANLLHRGKVRDTYDLGNGLLLMVATDRISAFDVVLPNGVPQKGIVLARMSAFWFRRTAHLIPNHFVGMAEELMQEPSPSRSPSPLAKERGRGRDLGDTPNPPRESRPVGTLDSLHVKEMLRSNRQLAYLPPEIAKRAMVVKRAQRINIECIVRGYLAGSAWAEYRAQGTIFGQRAPRGLKEGDRLPEPMFTPTTKAETGHDRNMTAEEVVGLVGEELAAELEVSSALVYNFAQHYALGRGIIIADTKMEFGLLDGELILIDELLTPDSSRFWDAATYRPGQSQPNYDKQFVRDWLNSAGWDHEPPAPELPQEILEKTSQRYLEAYSRLTGEAAQA